VGKFVGWLVVGEKYTQTCPELAPLPSLSLAPMAN